MWQPNEQNAFAFHKHLHRSPSSPVPGVQRGHLPKLLVQTTFSVWHLILRSSIYMLKKKLIITPVLGIPGGGRGSQELDLMLQFSEKACPLGSNLSSSTPCWCSWGRGVWEGRPLSQVGFSQHTGVAVPVCFEASLCSSLATVPWVTLSGRKNRSTHCLIHSVLTITSHSCLPEQGALW